MLEEASEVISGAFFRIVIPIAGRVIGFEKQILKQI